MKPRKPRKRRRFIAIPGDTHAALEAWRDRESRPGHHVTLGALVARLVDEAAAQRKETHNAR